MVKCVTRHRFQGMTFLRYLVLDCLEYHSFYNKMYKRQTQCQLDLKMNIKSEVES